MVATHTRFSFQLRGYSLPRPKTKVVDSSLWSSRPTALRAQKQRLRLHYRECRASLAFPRLQGPEAERVTPSMPHAAADEPPAQNQCRERGGLAVILVTRRGWKWCRECPFCTRSIWIVSDPERSRQFDETLGGTPCHGIEVRRIQCNRIASVRRNISDVRRGGRVVEGTRLLILYRLFCQIRSHYRTLVNQRFCRC